MSKEKIADGARPGPAMMNDCWSVELATGRTANLIATVGAPPGPRSHHTIAATSLETLVCAPIAVDGITIVTGLIKL